MYYLSLLLKYEIQDRHRLFVLRGGREGIVGGFTEAEFPKINRRFS